MTIYVYKAQGIGEHNIEPLEIRAEVAIPDLPDNEGTEAWRHASQRRFEDEGIKIAAALVEHLPGGTVDQVLRALLQHRASLFIVPFEQRQPETVTYPTTTDPDLTEHNSARRNGGAVHLAREFVGWYEQAGSQFYDDEGLHLFYREACEATGTAARWGWDDTRNRIIPLPGTDGDAACESKV